MDISAALADDLALLTQALGDTDDSPDTGPDTGLEACLHAFTADLERAIASYTALTMTIALDGHEVSFTVHDTEWQRSAAATSLLIPLAALTATEAGSTLLLYAGTPGAFVDLAADLSYALGIDPARLVLDGRLHPPGPSAGLIGLPERAAIDQALGVLIGRGHTPETATAELHRLAAPDHGDLHAAAQVLIRSACSGPTDTT